MERIAVIGAGVSGLAALKCCLEEGLSVTCLERSDDLGGLWNYDERPVEGRSSVMRSTTINSSKEMTCYSDFPMPAHFPNYCHHSKFFEYVRLYAERFDLRRHIRFGTEVVKARQVGHGSGRRWEVTTRSVRHEKERGVGSEEEVTERFDALMVCSGHHVEKNVVHFTGEQQFTGLILHSHDYRDHRGYEDKRVLVVGIGNSGTDVAVELGKISKQVYLSTRRGAWIVHRVSHHGLPKDLVVSRWAGLVRALTPGRLTDALMERRLNARFDHSLYGVRPAHRYSAHAPTISDELPNRVVSGAVVVKPDVKCLTERGVQFVDGTTLDDIDVIICATGYNFSFPFLASQPGLGVQDNRVDLYKHVFPPDVEPLASIAFIGCCQPTGGFLPIFELQCRWAARIFKGACTLPPRAEMWRDIARHRAALTRRFAAHASQPNHSIVVDWLSYQLDLTERCGCRPNLGLDVRALARTTGAGF